MAYISTLDRYAPADIPGITYRPDEVAHHGSGPGYEYVSPGRLVVDGTWPENRPETCDSDYPTEWIADGQIQVCTGCGLDCT